MAANSDIPRTGVFKLRDMRLLPLRGAEGGVMCSRVYGDQGKTVPRIARARFEFAGRSMARMMNLSAIRGTPGSSMVGPADYYGNFVSPHRYAYTIEIHDGIPQCYQTAPVAPAEAALQPLGASIPTRVGATWTSGRDADIDSKKEPYTGQGATVFGPSLFPNSGILEIAGGQDVRLAFFDARGIDLSAYKARLVPNSEPFQISTVALSASDEYRAVSYLYEPGYAAAQVDSGGGLFLETHDFAQTMTPLDADARGFVTVAKWADETRTALDIIAIHIPFGYTLIIDKDCIHGDATLDGQFMMCMTSNHITMQTADSVFLKDPLTQRNTRFIVDPGVALLHDEEAEIAGIPQDIQPDRPRAAGAPRPLVLYPNPTREQKEVFNQAVFGKNIICNPFFPEYWSMISGLAGHGLTRVLGIFASDSSGNGAASSTYSPAP